MAKLADATDLGSVGVTHGGSSPLRPTLFPFVHDSFSYDRGSDLGASLFPVDSSVPMMLGFTKIESVGLCSELFLLLAPSCPLHAMDEETAKTIADLKAQMQSLMDEVKKLKTQQSAPPATRPSSPSHV